MSKAYFNRTASRTLAVMEALAGEDDVLSLPELAARLACSKSSLFPILRTLEGAGYVRHEPGGGYALTPRILVLAQGVASRQRVTTLFDEVARSTVAQARESMQLAVLDGDAAVCVAQRPNERDLVRLTVDVGRRLPLHATALGKCLLAGLSDEEIHERLGGLRLPALTGKTVTSLDRLLEEVERARATGLGEAWQETADGLACVASPVRDGFRKVVGAIAFSVPLSRADPEHWGRLKRLALGAAAEMSARLGYQDEPL